MVPEETRGEFHLESNKEEFVKQKKGKAEKEKIGKTPPVSPGSRECPVESAFRRGHPARLLVQASAKEKNTGERRKMGIVNGQPQ